MTILGLKLTEKRIATAILKAGFILLMALTVNHNAHSEIFQKKSTDPDAFRYFNKTHNFTMNLPKSWVLSEGKNGTLVMAIRPSAGPREPFQENISVIVQKADPTQGIQTFLKQIVSQLQKGLYGFYLSEQGISKLGRGQGGWIIYAYEMNHRPVKAIQSFILMNNRAYTITGAASPTQFSKYRPIFHAIAESFTVGE